MVAIPARGPASTPSTARPLAWTLALLAFAAAATLLGSAHPAHAVVLDNGYVSIGLAPDAELNDPAGSTPCDNNANTNTGIRFDATNCDGISNGCLCEGWGVAYTQGAATTSGGANLASGEAPPCGGSSTTTDSSTYAIIVTPYCALEVTHDVHTTPLTNYLWEVNVTLRNVSPNPVTNVLYRRVMDWDIEPTATNEYTTITGVNAPAGPWPSALVRTTDDGFSQANPTSSASNTQDDDGLSGCGSVTAPWTASIPTNPPLEDNGPCDHGALFDFNFGTIAAGQEWNFTIYYGAAADEPSADAALAAVGAQIWSLGECGASSPGGSCSTSNPSGSTTNTFIFAFAHVVRAAPQPPTPVQCAPATQSVLPGTPASFTATFGTGTYSWSSPGSPATGTGASFQSSFAAPSSTPYTVTVTSGTNSDTCQVVVPGETFSAIVLNPGCNSDGVTTEPTDTPSGFFSSWSWDWGDGNTSTGHLGTHFYTQPGTYTITLTGQGNGLAVASTQTVTTTLQVCPPSIDPLPIDVVAETDTAAACAIGHAGRGGTLTYSWGGLPPGASGHGPCMVWPTQIGQAGHYACLQVTVTEVPGGLSASTCQEVLVRPPPPKPILDTDLDGIADSMDNCPSVPNHDQLDLDQDGIGDACEPHAPSAAAHASAPHMANGLPDTDQDGIADIADNCPGVANWNQADMDGDGAGDLCDPDVDGDGVPNVSSTGVALDDCPFLADPQQDCMARGLGGVVGNPSTRPGTSATAANGEPAPASGGISLLALSGGGLAFLAVLGGALYLGLARAGRRGPD